MSGKVEICSVEKIYSVNDIFIVVGALPKWNMHRFEGRIEWHYMYKFARGYNIFYIAGPQAGFGPDLDHGNWDPNLNSNFENEI